MIKHNGFWEAFSGMTEKIPRIYRRDVFDSDSEWDGTF